ncbi:Cut9-interacting protein scn1 [Parachaetomium inaequale]|uniref:Cut9-interacting protein scn1 n=1 Tax=Parachaetomium inaequale TaxID=2588326 RepID=A0AAN6PC51_9PEZI|nr:Cut9-interacting protein scn1 [Parachaetomium inaequale]
MCHQDDDHTPPATPERNDSRANDFPWHIGVCDAHCHPTDTMSSVASISSMRARALTIMSTRSQDQDLVASVAAKSSIRDRSALASPATQDTPDKIIPAFGWHPWFSHQLYDDTEASSSTTYDPADQQQKTIHYTAVLSPAPDAAFVASLPDPLPLSTFLAATRQRVLDAAGGGTALIGEVGLDKAFRLPWPWNTAEHSHSHSTPGQQQQQQQQQRDDSSPLLTPGGREGRTLSPHHVRMPHQVAVLKAQLRLAGELGVAASVHGVQAHGVLFDALAGLWKGHEREVVSRRKQKMVAKGAEDFSESEKEEEGSAAAGKRYKPKPFPPRVCLHSFSGSPQTVQQYLNPAIPVDVFFSFSTVINLSTAGGESRFPDVVRACPDDRLLVESDLHCAGEEMDRVLEDICRRVCEIKGWALEEGLARIRRNYEAFIFG